MKSATRVILALLVLGTPAWLTAQPNFSGQWTLNERMSQDPFEKIDGVLGTSQLKGAGTASFNAYSRGTLLKDTDRAGLRNALFDFAEVLSVMDIEQDDAEIQISVGDGDNYFALFYLDGQEHSRQLPAGDRVKARATWDGELLRIVQKIDGGSTLTELYSLMTEDQMAVVYQLDTKVADSPVMFRVVYDRAKD